MIVAGAHQLHSAFHYKKKMQLLGDMEKLTPMLKLQDEPGMKDKILETLKAVGIFMLYELALVAGVLLGALYFSNSVLFLFILSTLGLSYVSKKLRDNLSKSDYHIYYVADNLYCAAVYIIGPLLVR